jgi:nucleoside-diphosphate-sugar epimerase
LVSGIVILYGEVVDGTGAGPINQHSLQVPALIKIALHEKQAVVLGAGKGIWTFVHISDVAAFYCRLLDHYLSDKAVDVGKKGFYFLEAGETTWLEISQHIAKAGYAQGHWASEELKSITPQQMKEALGVPFLNADMVEVIWGSK